MNPQTHFLLLDVDGVLITPDDFYGAKLAREHGSAMQEFMRGPFRLASIGKSDLLDDSAENVAAARAAGWQAQFFDGVGGFRRVMGL